MATDTIVPNGAETSKHAVVFGLFPGDSTFYTIVERAPEVGGAPGTPTKVAWLKPGVRYYIEQRNPTTTFSYYRFMHAGFGFGFGTPSEWFRARPVAWSGEIPNIPAAPLLDMDLALDDSDGTVDLVVNGGRKVASIEWDFSTSSFPTEPTTTVNTDAEGDVTVTDAFTLAGGQTGYVTVQFFDQASGGGNLLGTLRQSRTRPVGVGQGGALVLNGDFEADTDGAFWGQDGSACSIESASPISGAKSLKITSRVDDVVCHQVKSSVGFGGAGTVDKRRLIQVEPGETFEVRAAASGYSDAKMRLSAIEYDEDQASAGVTTISAFGATGGLITSISAYTVPDGVRYINWAWVGAPDASAPRTMLADNFTARRIDSTVTGIPTEVSLGGTYYIDESQITPDSSGGSEGSNPGHVYWGDTAWKFFHPSGSRYVVASATVTLVSLDGTKANSADLMCYVATNSGRFTGLADTAMRRIVGVRKSRSAGWQYLGDSGWVGFTPNTNDALMAQPEFTAEVV